MSSNRRTRSMVRYAKRMPGYRFARRTLLPKVRRNRTARDLARRVFEIQTAPGRGRVTDVAPGNVLGGIGAEKLPVVAIVALDTPSDAIADLVDNVAQLQVLTAGFRPVFVLTAAELASTRHYGYVAELLMPEHDWPHQEMRWQDYRDQRLNTIVQHYGTSCTVTAGPEGLDPTGRMLLGALTPPARSVAH